MYESPLSRIYEEIQTKIIEQQENQIVQAVLNCGISVDKEELIKALMYDRQQYEKGYADAKAEERWIPCSERLPEESGQYYVSGGDKVWICEFLIIPSFTGGWCNDALNPRVQAWMEKTEPYRGEA